MIYTDHNYNSEQPFKLLDMRLTGWYPASSFAWLLTRKTKKTFEAALQPVRNEWIISCWANHAIFRSHCQTKVTCIRNIHPSESYLGSHTQPFIVPGRVIQGQSFLALQSQTRSLRDCRLKYIHRLSGRIWTDCQHSTDQCLISDIRTVTQNMFAGFYNNDSLKS